MNIATITFFAIVAGCAWRGYRRGLLRSVLVIAGGVAAYVAAILLTRPVAEFLVDKSALDGLLVYIVAGSAVFCVASLLLNVPLKLLARRNAAPELSHGAKLGGAAIGVVAGTLVGLLAVYAISLVQQPQTVEVTPGVWTPVSTGEDAYARSPLDTFLVTNARKLLGAAAELAVDIALDDPSAAQFARAFVEDPRAMMGHAQQMANDERVTALMSDAQFQQRVKAGDVDAVMATPAFQDLMQDSHVQALVAESGADPEASEREVAETLVTVMGRAARIQEDPRVVAILNDPDFQRKLNAQDRLALVTDPRLKELTEILFSGSTAPEGTQRP